MIEIRQVKPDSQEMADFLALPAKIYPKDRLMQDKAEEKAQLTGQHALSSQYSFRAYVGYRNGQVLIRAALITYPTMLQAYLGYFEAFNDKEMMQALIANLSQEAKDLGCHSIIGPIQASFWLGYRLRLNAFDQAPFTGEPNQPAYYQELWQAEGFILKEKYLSNFYQQIPAGAHQRRLAKRYEQFLAKGYQIISPKRKDWEQVSLEVFDLLRQVYAHFPVFQSISRQQFAQLFAPYKQILDFSMVKLAYLDGALVGFLITMPDYGNLVYGKMTPFKLLKILRIRRRAKRYLIMYLGVGDDHLGLGSALTHPIYEAIRERHAHAVGALIHQGTVTENYVPELQENQHYYGLFVLDLE